MAKEIFAGRRNFKRDFSRYLAEMAAEGKDTRPFLSFRKQTNENELWPRIFMFYGETGTGKSAMVDQCLNWARSMGSETKKPIKVLLLDGEDISLRNIITMRNLIEALYAVFIAEDSALATYLTEYSQLKQRVEHIEDKVKLLMMHEWYHEKLVKPDQSQKTKKQEKNAGTPGQCIAQDLQCAQTPEFRSWLCENKKLPEDELDLYKNSDYRLSKALVNGIVQLSAEYPVVLAIDAFDRVCTREIEDWMRTVFLGKLFERKNKVMVIISGRENLIRNYRNSFQEEMLYPLDCDSLLLSKSDINECAQTCQVKLGREEINDIEENSRGIPLVVRDILGLVKNSAPLSEVLKETERTGASIDHLVAAEIPRFLKQCPDSAVKKKIVQCALMYQLEGNVLAKLWNVSYADVSTILTDLSEQYPFISCKRLHETGHRLLRDHLIKETGKNTEITSMIKEFGAAAAHFYSEQVDELNTAIVSMEKRYDDQRYQLTLLAYCTSLVWDNAGQLFKILPGIVLECLQYNCSFALRLLQRIDEFRTLFTKNQCKNIDIMKDGVRAFNPLGMWLFVQPSEEETALLKLLEEKSADCTEQQRALHYCRKGESYYRSAQYDSACEEFERCLPFIKESTGFEKTVVDSLNTAGALFLSSQKNEAAVRVYKQVVLLRPDDHEAWYAMGRAQTETGMHAEAAVSYAKTVELKPDLHDAWLRLGREYYALESFDMASQAFEKALGDKPDGADAGDWYKLGKSYRALDQNGKAIEAFKKAVGLDPGKKDFWYDFANAYTAAGQDDDAAGAYEKTVQIDPACHDAWSALGKLYYQCGRYDASIEAYAKVLEAVPDNKSALYAVALALHARGSYVEAVAYFGKFLELEPANAEALYTMALSLHGCGQYSDAIQFYKKATDAQPGNIDAWHNMGRAYRAQGLNQDAVDVYRKALALDPEKPELWDDLGLVFNAMNLWGDAIQCFKNLVKLDPNWAQASYHLGLTYYQVRHFEDALKSYMTAVEADPGYYRAWGSMGSTYYSMGNFDKAIEASAKALSIKPDELWVLCNLALAYVLSRKFDEAAKEYEKIISLAKTKKDLLQAMTALAEVLDGNQGLSGAQGILQKLKDALKNM
jgi:Flp pilus assembly protein TadD, contains TPR repeats